jgi:hypothetical protein|tara:strand:- start:322 stop:480 length:159 start_codon:yes stop_codon:yes gene_type:complete
MKKKNLSVSSIYETGRKDMVREIIKKLKKSRDKENIVIIELIDELKEEYLKE